MPERDIKNVFFPPNVRPSRDEVDAFLDSESQRTGEVANFSGLVRRLLRKEMDRVRRATAKLDKVGPVV